MSVPPIYSHTALAYCPAHELEHWIATRAPPRAVCDLLVIDPGRVAAVRSHVPPPDLLVPAHLAAWEAAVVRYRTVLFVPSSYLRASILLTALAARDSQRKPIHRVARTVICLTRKPDAQAPIHPGRFCGAWHTQEGVFIVGRPVLAVNATAADVVQQVADRRVDAQDLRNVLEEACASALAATDFCRSHQRPPLPPPRIVVATCDPLTRLDALHMIRQPSERFMGLRHLAARIDTVNVHATVSLRVPVAVALSCLHPQSIVTTELDSHDSHNTPQQTKRSTHGRTLLSPTSPAWPPLEWTASFVPQPDDGTWCA